ncbi:uncharacterized protein LOC129890515 [Solanum dulcamara]|uniref:uncharacterized protein LOC129890515 n=1 Tax=Solanum dulcamara TaxID=45834 RepID=UPI0024868F86|nr:uncharacterized protein LOC129890515 [Solanum dulcamara]
MLIKEVDISWLITFTEQIEGEKLKEMRMRNSKKAWNEGGFSNARSDGGSGHFQQGKCSGKKKSHGGRYFIGTGACFRCGKMGHRKSECPYVTNKGREGCPQGQVSQGGQVPQGAQTQPKGGQCNNRFYAIHDRQEVEETLDVVTSILWVFHCDIYALLDLDANLSFVTPYVTMRFDLSLEILMEHFSIYTPVRSLGVTGEVAAI